MLVMCQSDGPPVGSLVVRTSPLLSTATQKELAGQETAVIWLEPSRWMVCQAEAPPAGLVEKLIVPVPPPTQSVALWQLTTVAGTAAACQAAGPPPGSVDVAMPTPVSFVVMHSTGESGTQDNDPGNLNGTAPTLRCHAGKSAAGSEAVSTDPALSKATHSEVVAHETWPRAGPEPRGGVSGNTGADQVSGGVAVAAA